MPDQLFNKKLTTFIKEQTKFLEKLLQKHSSEKDQYMTILIQALKLTEETGEVIQALLEFLRIRNKSPKTKAELESHLAEELADIILVALILAELTKVDIQKALKNKIEAVKKRRTHLTKST